MLTSVNCRNRIPWFTTLDGMLVIKADEMSIFTILDGKFPQIFKKGTCIMIIRVFKVELARLPYI